MSEIELAGLPGLVLAFSISIVIGALMVSKFSYWSGKELNMRGRIPWVYALFIPLIYVLVSLARNRCSRSSARMRCMRPLYWLVRKLRPQKRVADRRLAAPVLTRALRMLQLRSIHPHPLCESLRSWILAASPIYALDIDVWERRDCRASPRAVRRCRSRRAVDRQRLPSARDRRAGDPRARMDWDASSASRSQLHAMPAA